jgi:hypothetical protein
MRNVFGRIKIFVFRNVFQILHRLQIPLLCLQRTKYNDNAQFGCFYKRASSCTVSSSERSKTIEKYATSIFILIRISSLIVNVFWSARKNSYEILYFCNRSVVSASVMCYCMCNACRNGKSVLFLQVWAIKNQPTFSFLECRMGTTIVTSLRRF